MITVYTLENCKYCKELLKYFKKNPTQNVCLIMISKDDLQSIYNNEPRISQFPIAFTGTPKTNGLPYKNSHSIIGSDTILQTLKNNFGKNKDLTGNGIVINYLNDNEGNINSLNNIQRHRNNCFGYNCHVMDRPFGPMDNQFILQGYQTPCAIPKRSYLPIKAPNKFGMTTPGTKEWKMEREVWQEPKMLVNGNNCEQNLLGNVYTNANSPLTYSHDSINRKIYNPIKLANSNKFGNKSNKFVSAPVNSNYPLLTYAAGSDTISRVTGRNYLPEQKPIKSPFNNAYISGNLKNYSKKHSSVQELLSGGFAFGKKYITNKNDKPNKNKYGEQIVQTAFNSSQGNSGVAQQWKPNPFINNGNGFGNRHNIKTTDGYNGRIISSQKPKLKVHKPNKTKIENKHKKKSSRKMKYTSPLGIEISFD